jgi:hypothetical protein
MIRMARFTNYAWLGLAISSLLGLMARHIAPLGIGVWVIVLILLFGLGTAVIAGNLLDHYFGWVPDTSLGLAIGLLGIFIIGSAIGWLLLI